MKNERMAIPGHPGYYADRSGRIWSNRQGRWRLVKSIVNSNGYQYTRLGQRQQNLTQRLVCTAFKGEHTDNLPVCIRQAPRQQARRVRRQRYLHWGNRSEVRRKPFTPLTNDEKLEVLGLWMQGYKQVEIARMYGVSQPAISYIVRGYTKVQ